MHNLFVLLAVKDDLTSTGDVNTACSAAEAGPHPAVLNDLVIIFVLDGAFNLTCRQGEARLYWDFLHRSCDS